MRGSAFVVAASLLLAGTCDAVVGESFRATAGQSDPSREPKVDLAAVRRICAEHGLALVDSAPEGEEWRWAGTEETAGISVHLKQYEDAIDVSLSQDPVGGWGGGPTPKYRALRQAIHEGLVQQFGWGNVQ
jgi:hypothetical protein